MRAKGFRGIAAGLALAGLALAGLLAGPAAAQQLNGALGGALNALGGAVGGGGGMGLPSLGNASLGNIAGLLEYCVTNNLLGGASGSAAPVEQSLLGRLGGQAQAAGNPDYSAGANGLLQTGGGQNFNLGGSDMMAQLKQQACSMILQHAQSLL